MFLRCHELTKESIFKRLIAFYRFPFDFSLWHCFISIHFTLNNLSYLCVFVLYTVTLNRKTCVGSL